MTLAGHEQENKIRRSMVDLVRSYTESYRYAGQINLTSVTLPPFCFLPFHFMTPTESEDFQEKEEKHNNNLFLTRLLFELFRLFSSLSYISFSLSLSLSLSLLFVVCLAAFSFFYSFHFLVSTSKLTGQKQGPYRSVDWALGHWLSSLSDCVITSD